MTQEQAFFIIKKINKVVEKYTTWQDKRVKVNWLKFGQEIGRDAYGEVWISYTLNNEKEEFRTSEEEFRKLSRQEVSDIIKKLIINLEIKEKNA
jgi:hypothetical protein